MKRWLPALALGLLAAVTVGEADTLADPMRPAGIAGVSQPARVARAAPVVSAILIGNGRRVAIVDGHTVQAGERIGDTRIDEILDTAVRYTRAGSTALSELPRTALRVRSALRTQARLGDTKQ